MATQLVLDDLFSFVESALKPEGAEKYDVNHARALLRQCIATIFRETKAHYTSWSNATGGDLTIVGNQCNLPPENLEVLTVEWNGAANALPQKTIAYMDLCYPGWQDVTGTTPSYCIILGNKIMFDLAPTGTVTGLLKVRGFGVPDISDVLDMLPADIQLRPASYILSEWAVDAESKSSIFRFNKYTAKWAMDSAAIIQAIRERAMQTFTIE